MKSFLGLCVLSVALVGLLCVQPASSFYEDEKSDTVSRVTEVVLTEPVPGVSDSESNVAITNEENNNDEKEENHPDKRQNGFGMPTMADRGNSNPEQQQQQQPPLMAAQEMPGSQVVSLPVNPPASQVLDATTGQQPPASTARGLVGDMTETITMQGGSPQQQSGQDPSNLLPTVIEKNQVTQQQSQQQTAPILSQGTALTAPFGQTPANVTISGARSITDNWVNCVGGSSKKHGTCKNDVECKKSKGISDGTCMGGFGVCCVMALTCGDKSTENNTFFANADFPEPSWEARLCEVEVKKKHKNILQVMIEFEEFELAPPNHDGECITDVFQVKLASSRPSPYSLLRICGQNTGQHMYLDVSQIEEPLVLSVATSGGGYPRRWSIRIIQMDEKNFLLAPPGCLQYYTDTVGHFRSFNLGKNLRNLYYAICFRIDNGYSGIRFTSNFFGMNGPQCRRKPGPPAIGGHFNQSHIVAHPHHLVIPPPGYAPPPPRPRYELANLQHQPRPLQYPQVPLQQQVIVQPTPIYQQRVKRFAYSEPDMDARYTRTFHEHKMDDKKWKLEEKHQPKHEHELQPNPYPPQVLQYGNYAQLYPQQPAYGQQQQAYGPQQPYYVQQEYPRYQQQEHGKKDEKWSASKKHPHEHEHEDSKKGWGWKEHMDSAFGWKSDKKEDKHDNYGPPPNTYMPSYGGYGPPPQHHHHHQHQHEGQYGGGQGYGYAGGAYHHKEIDKFGKKYEHLEYKHEKNHLDKEQKKDDKNWWFWSKKEEKKDKKDKEKFFQHHDAMFPLIQMPEMPHCEPRFCGQSDVITFPPSGDSISEMCGNRFNRGRGPKIISGSPLVVYVSNRGMQRGGGFDMNYEQVFYIPRPY